MRTICLGAALAGCSLALAPQAMAQTAQAAQAEPASDKARIQELEAQLRRQTLIADNARQEVEALRAQARQREELITLARERNADLYAVASEILDLGLRPRAFEPLLQERRVKLENLKQDFEDRLNRARVFADTLPPSVQKQMDEELQARRAAAASSSQD